MVHQCTRCELRFASEGELKGHLADDHDQAGAFERYRYPGRRTLDPLYAADVDDPARPRRYLVVANQTLGGPELTATIRQRVSLGPATFFVLVPATHSADYPQRSYAAIGRDPGVRDDSDDHGLARARVRLRQAVDQLQAMGVEAEGEVGPPEPFMAIRDVLQRERFDEIILSTLPEGSSRWLGVNLPERIERHVKLPVTTVIAADRSRSSDTG